MRHGFRHLLLLILFACCLGASPATLAQAQDSASSSTPAAKRSDIEHKLQLQLLVASAAVNNKTDYPPSLEPIVRQLKASLPFKAHKLVATYLYNISDGSNLEVNDVTYAPFENNSGLVPTFFVLGISGLKLNAAGNSVHLSRFRFEARKRIFTENISTEANTTIPVYNTVTTGISTELNLREGVPTIVGTTTSALSDGVLVLVLTINPTELR